MLVIRFAGKVCAAVVVAAAIGAAPAWAAPGLLLEPAAQTDTQTEVAQPAPIFVPDSGSAGVYNNFMCQLHTISASVPCMYT
ncbi:hypothetical protein OIE68_28050 [Nocardia vinacea]|uniref:hypothetical protein n=1 Tax=Nocardia vinacea TaxID=96468 RepID=UPI002E148071|nr:hypothetical protein OIE68_28050 [Nocardia vinacea]